MYIWRLPMRLCWPGPQPNQLRPKDLQNTSNWKTKNSFLLPFFLLCHSSLWVWVGASSPRSANCKSKFEGKKHRKRPWQRQIFCSIWGTASTWEPSKPPLTTATPPISPPTTPSNAIASFTDLTLLSEVTRFFSLFFPSPLEVFHSVSGFPFCLNFGFCFISSWSMRSIPLPPRLSKPSSYSLSTSLVPIARFFFSPRSGSFFVWLDVVFYWKLLISDFGSEISLIL